MILKQLHLLLSFTGVKFVALVLVLLSSRFGISCFTHQQQTEACKALDYEELPTPLPISTPLARLPGTLEAVLAAACEAGGRSGGKRRRRVKRSRICSEVSCGASARAGTSAPPAERNASSGRTPPVVRA